MSMATAVRFIEGGGILSLLEVESEHGADPLAVVAGLLFQMRVQVVRAETIAEGDRVRSLFHVVEFDGARIESPRRREIQTGLRDVIDRPRGLRQARPAVVSRALLAAPAPRS
jgi:UTP:GlnB (protein PII) uridylyltransferase